MSFPASAAALRRTHPVSAAGVPDNHLAIAAIGDVNGGGHGVLRIVDGSTEIRRIMSCDQLDELAALAAAASNAIRAHAAGDNVVTLGARGRA